jgi:hypothetical protein
MLVLMPFLSLCSFKGCKAFTKFDGVIINKSQIDLSKENLFLSKKISLVVCICPVEIGKIIRKIIKNKKNLSNIFFIVYLTPDF